MLALYIIKCAKKSKTAFIRLHNRGFGDEGGKAVCPTNVMKSQTAMFQSVNLRNINF